MFAPSKRAHLSFFRSCLLPSFTLSTRCDSARISSLEFAGDGEMITDEKLERLREKVEQQRRELEEMQRAIAAYTGPVTKCPPFKTTDPSARPKGRPRWPRRNADGR
jgi:hypothetical protein